MIGSSTLLFSIALFYWHINENHFVLHIILYYIVNFFSVIGFIYLCRSLNSIRLQLITMISIGTMFIFGTHRIIIGLIDYTFEKILQITDISYSLPKAIILAIGIEVVLLPLILYSQRRHPILLGKRKII